MKSPPLLTADAKRVEDRLQREVSEKKSCIRQVILIETLAKGEESFLYLVLKRKRKCMLGTDRSSPYLPEF